MSTVVDDNLPTLNDGRQLLVDFGLRKYRVFVRVRTYAGGEVRLGAHADVDTEITPRPKVVEFVNSTELRVSGITPDFAVGGYTLADLNPTALVDAEVLYVVRNAEGNDSIFELYDIDSSGVFGVELKLRALDRPLPR
jgi:hypothetical protein